MNTKTKTTSKPKATAKAKKVESTSVDEIIKEYSGSYRITIGSAAIRKEKITTGSIVLDKALGGGFVKGKIIEIYGPESVGKTALALTIMAQAKGNTAYIDCESNYDKETTEMYGVNTDKMYWVQPEFIEQGMEATIDLTKKRVEVIVFDSVAGIGTKSEMEGSMEDHNVGKKASRMGQLMRKLHLEAFDSGTVEIFINQIRDSMAMFGDPTTTPGGKALKFHASYRLQFTKKERIMRGEDLIGHYMVGKLLKNKLGHPEINLKIPLIYGHGISKEWELIDVAVEKGIIEKSGSWFSYDGTKLAQGQFNTMEVLQDHPELFDEIYAKL